MFAEVDGLFVSELEYVTCLLPEELKDEVIEIMDGCGNKGSPDRNDWVTNGKVQGELYWAVKKVIELLKIEDNPPRG